MIESVQTPGIVQQSVNEAIKDAATVMLTEHRLERRLLQIGETSTLKSHSSARAGRRPALTSYESLPKIFSRFGKVGVAD